MGRGAPVHVSQQWRRTCFEFHLLDAHREMKKQMKRLITLAAVAGNMIIDAFALVGLVGLAIIVALMLLFAPFRCYG